MYSSSKRKIEPTGRLLGTGDPQDRAELQWRVGAPIAVLVLTLLAVPLSYIRPRQGRYGKLVIGILAYLIYSQLLGVAQNRSEEHTSELQSLMRISYAVFCLKKKKQ